MPAVDPFDDFSMLLPSPSKKNVHSQENLSTMNDNGLLQHLVAQHQAMARHDQVPEGDAGPLSEKYVMQILSPFVGNHPKNDIKVLAACIMADALRVVAPNFPFPEGSVTEAFRLFATVLSIFSEPAIRDIPTNYVHHLLTCIAEVHGMYALCKAAHQQDEAKADEEIFGIVKALLIYGKREASVGTPCAGIISDIILSSHSMTDKVFHLLMGELLKHSNVAQLVLSSHVKQMQHLIHDHITRACANLIGAYAHYNDNPEEKRKTGKNITHTLELVQKIASTSPSCIKKTLETLIQYTCVEQPEIRVIFVKGLGKIFENDPALLLGSQGALQVFITRFADSRPVVRNEMLRMAYKMLDASANQQIKKELWNVFVEPLRAKLLDADDSVRRNSVLMITTMNFASVPQALARAVGDRCRDKRPNVRHLAINQLAKAVSSVKDSAHMEWLPNAVLHTYRADSGTNQRVVEAALQSIIECYADSFAGLCRYFDAHSFSVVKEIFSQMYRLRRVVHRLFELKQDATQEEVAAKLVLFLSNQLPVENADAFEEWKTISEVKDRKFLRSIADSFVYADSFREAVHHIKRIWRKSTCDYFTRVLARFILPIHPDYASRVSQCVEEFRITANAQCGLFSAFYLLRVYDPSSIKDIHRVAEWLLTDMRAAVEQSSSVDFGNISLFFYFLLEQSNQTQTVMERVQSAPFMHALTSFSIVIPTERYELCKTAAKALASFLEMHNPSYQEVLRTLFEKYRSLSSVQRANVFIVYRELVLKGKLILTKGTSVDADELLNNIRTCVDSSEEESGGALQAAMRLKKAHFEGQNSVHASKVTNYMTLLLEIAARFSYDGCEPPKSRKRLSIMKQLIALVRSGKIRTCIFDNMQLLQAFANALSGTDTKENRATLQRKLYRHLHFTMELPLQCTAFLLIMALAETDRHNLSKLREYMRNIVEKYRGIAMQQMASQSVSLSDPRAITCYPEYIFPVLVYLLAHSPFFLDEREKSYLSIQRVLVIFFEETLGRNNECASFLLELIQTIRSHDDRYAMASPNTRIVCDIALKDLQEVLKVRSLRAESLHAFPGSVQLPHFFVQPTKNAISLDTTVFLPDDFPVIRIGFGGLLSFAHGPEQPHEIVPLPKTAVPDEEEFDEGRAARIAEIVKEKYGHLSEDEVSLIPWKKMRQEIAEALGVENLDNESRKAAWRAIEALHEDQ